MRVSKNTQQIQNVFSQKFKKEPPPHSHLPKTSNQDKGEALFLSMKFQSFQIDYYAYASLLLDEERQTRTRFPRIIRIRPRVKKAKPSTWAFLSTILIRIQFQTNMKRLSAAEHLHRDASTFLVRPRSTTNLPRIASRFQETRHEDPALVCTETTSDSQDAWNALAQLALVVSLQQKNMSFESSPTSSMTLSKPPKTIREPKVLSKKSTGTTTHTPNTTLTKPSSWSVPILHSDQPNSPKPSHEKKNPRTSSIFANMSRWMMKKQSHTNSSNVSKEKPFSLKRKVDATGGLVTETSESKNGSVHPQTAPRKQPLPSPQLYTNTNSVATVNDPLFPPEPKRSKVVVSEEKVQNPLRSSNPTTVRSITTPSGFDKFQQKTPRIENPSDHSSSPVQENVTMEGINKKDDSSDSPVFLKSTLPSSSSKQHSPNLPPLRILCSEDFLESWSTAVAQLSSGSWADTFGEETENDVLAALEFKSKPTGRVIDLVDIHLLTWCSLEFASRSGGIVLDTKLLDEINEAKSIVQGLIELAASGRYRKITVFLVQDPNEGPTNVSRLANLQTATLGAGIQLASTVSFLTTSPRTLAASIAVQAQALEKMSPNGTSNILNSISSSSLTNEIVFLLSIVPCLSVQGAIQCLQFSTGLVGLLHPRPDARSEIHNNIAAQNPRTSEIHPYAMIQLTHSLRAHIGKRPLRLRQF